MTIPTIYLLYPYEDQGDVYAFKAYKFDPNVDAVMLPDLTQVVKNPGAFYQKDLWQKVPNAETSVKGAGRLFPAWLVIKDSICSR